MTGLTYVMLVHDWKKTFGGGTLCVECVTTEVSSGKGGNIGQEISERKDHMVEQIAEKY